MQYLVAFAYCLLVAALVRSDRAARLLLAAPIAPLLVPGWLAVNLVVVDLLILEGLFALDWESAPTLFGWGRSLSIPAILLALPPGIWQARLIARWLLEVLGR